MLKIAFLVKSGKRVSPSWRISAGVEDRNFPENHSLSLDADPFEKRHGQKSGEFVSPMAHKNTNEDERVQVARVAMAGRPRDVGAYIRRLARRDQEGLPALASRLTDRWRACHLRRSAWGKRPHGLGKERGWRPRVSEASRPSLRVARATGKRNGDSMPIAPKGRGS